MSPAYFIPVIHAHFPFYASDEGYDRLFAEYLVANIIPFLRMCDRLETDDVKYGITVSFSPSLLALLSREQTVDFCRNYLKNTISTASDIATRTGASAQEISRLDYLRDIYFWFCERFSCAIPAALQRIASFGNVELAATSATEAPLPLFADSPLMLSGQIKTGCDSFADTFGFSPSALWLCDAPYFVNLELILGKCGISSFFCSPKSFTHASCAVKHGIKQPVWVADGVSAFAINPDFTAQIASTETGYYKDHDYLAPPQDCAGWFTLPASRQQQGDGKKYDAATALAKCDLHAGHYLSELGKSLTPDSICVIELDIAWFGKHWFEGAHFFDLLLRKMCFDQDKVKAYTPSGYLRDHKRLQQIALGEAALSGSEVFTSFYKDDNDSFLPELHLAAERLSIASGDERVLRQMARELIMAQAGDCLLAKTDAAARKSVSFKHLSRFCALDKMLIGSNVDEKLLQVLKEDSPTFSNFPLSYFRQ